jgi:hypothetical protein
MGSEAPEAAFHSLAPNPSGPREELFRNGSLVFRVDSPFDYVREFCVAKGQLTARFVSFQSLAGSGSCGFSS